MSNDSTSKCIFCRILTGELPNYTVFENEYALAFLDIFPRSQGHTVVIPKKHTETIFGFDEVEMGNFAKAVQTTTRRLNEVLKPDGFTIGWNHGAAGGQEVPHLHAHILPRWTGDGGRGIQSVVQHPGGDSVATVAQLFISGDGQSV